MPGIEQCDKSFKIVMSVIIMGDGRDGNAIAGKGICVSFVVLLIGSTFTHAAIAPNTFVRIALGIAKAFYFNFMLCPVPTLLLAVPFSSYAP
jgi:hypothetical protein